MPTVPGRSKYSDLFDEQDREQSSRISRAVYLSADTNPDQESALHKISQRSGIPVEALRLDNGTEAKRRIAVQEVESLPTVAPRTAEYLTNPENARLSYDDVQELAKIEGMFLRPVSTVGIASPNDQKTGKRAKSIGGAFVEGVTVAPEKVNEGLARTGQMLADFVDWSLAALPDETGLRKRIADTAKESADYWKNAAAAKAPAKEAGTVESYFQQAGQSIGTSILAAPFGIGGEGAALGMFGLFSEGGYEEMRQGGVSQPVAMALGTSNKLMEGLTEKLGLDRIYNGTGPILKKAIGFVLGDLAGEEINTLYSALVDKVTIKPDMAMSDVIQQVIDTAIVSSIAGPAQGVTMSGAAKASGSLYDNYLKQQQAKQAESFLLALGDGVKASKTFARLPEKVQELVKAAKENGPVSDVFVPVERFTELFQSQGINPTQAAEQILSDPKRFYEAAANGGDVAIPLEEFATLANEPFFAELVKDSRTSIDGMTPREAEAFGADSESFINDLLSQASEEAPVEDAKYQDAYQRIYDDTYGQLIGIGRDPGQAKADATIRAKGLATLAERYGYDPADLEKRFPMVITRGDTAPSMAAQTMGQGKDKKRGYIRFDKGIPSFEVGLLKDADSSTFLHESGHYYLEVMGRLSEPEEVPKTLKADYQTILNWLGAESREKITVEQNEKFARGFEAYLFEGNAPSQELRGVFQRFKVWLKAVYSSLKSLNVELSDEVRGVFDRLLATDEEIAAAENEQNVKPIFTTAEEAGMSPAVFEAYRELAEQAHKEAKDRLERRKLKEIKRQQEAWWKEEKEKVRAEVEAEAKENPVYEAVNFLYTGKLFDGSVFEGEVFKLSKTDLLKMYDAVTLKAIQKKLGYVYKVEGGLSPDVVAEMFGFSSADEMVKRMMEAPKLREYVKAETDRRMLERHGEMNAAEIAEAAILAVHNDDQAKLLREEMKALQRKAKGAAGVSPVEFYKETARRVLSGKKVSEIMPGVYSRAEAKAANEAINFAAEKKYREAAAAKQRQLLNHYLYREAVQSREDADKIAAYMRRLEKPKAQQRIGKAGQDYLEQVNALLEQYEFRRVTNERMGERERLIDWLERKEKETGISPPIPSSILEDALQVNYRTLTIEKLRDVFTTVEAIVHLAREDGKIQVGEQKREIAELADEAAASIEEHSKGQKPRKPEKNLPQDRPGALIENYFASHRKMSSLARQMDGSNDGGVMWNLIIWPLNEAGDKEAVMRAEAAEKLNGIFRAYSALERTKMHRREFIPEINTSMSKWGRIVVALNMGNEGNRQRLASMFKPEQVSAIVDTLDERDWQFVQNVWDAINEYWPAIEAKEKRVHGVAPDKVAAMPVPTKYGTLRGGYYPIKYDREETAKTGAQEEEEIYKQMMGGAFTRATTRHGHTEARLEAVNRPLSLSIDTLFQHMNQVIHDLTHHETLMNVNRILSTDQVQEAIRDYYGMEAYRVFMDGIRDVAIGDIPATDAFEKFTAYSRVGISTAGLGYNLITSMMQPLGLTQSMVRIGTKWVGKGIGRWMGSPKRMFTGVPEMIYEKSAFMRLRGKTQMREVAEIRNQLTVGVIPHAVRDSFFYFIQQGQKLVDIPTWLGQYEKSMDAHGNETDAIAEADQAVIDSQASGYIKDLARIQRGGPLKKLFTTFYSFFSTTYNLAAEARGRTHFKNPSEVGRFMVDMLLLYTVPVVLVTMLKEGINRAIGGDDDDEDLLKKLAGEQLGYVMGGFIGLRELSSTFTGFYGYEGPAGARVYSETGKLVKEVEQGEWDAGLFKRLNSAGGILLHYPSTQVQRVTDGMIELSEGRGNMLSLLFGKPKK